MHGRADPCSTSYTHVKSMYPASRLALPCSHRAVIAPGRVSQRFRRRAAQVLAGLSPDQIQDLLAPLSDHLFLAYERVVMPCHNMNCGDVVHRR